MAHRSPASTPPGMLLTKPLKKSESNSPDCKCGESCGNNELVMRSWVGVHVSQRWLLCSRSRKFNNLTPVDKSRIFWWNWAVLLSAVKFCMFADSSLSLRYRKILSHPLAWGSMSVIASHLLVQCFGRRSNSDQCCSRDVYLFASERLCDISPT